MALILLLLLSLSSAQKYTKIDPSMDFSPCNCDLTENSCDSYCCCDEDCDQTSLNSDTETQSIIDIWKANDLCKPEGTDRDIYSATDCFKSTTTAKLDDLKFGL